MNRKKDNPETWTIVLTPEASSVPSACRVRKLLKFAGRVLGLRAVSVLEKPQGVPDSTQTGESDVKPGKGHSSDQ